MNIPPVPLEKLLRAESISRSLHNLSRDELEHYTKELVTLTVKLTHYTNEMRTLLAKMELGLTPEG